MLLLFGTAMTTSFFDSLNPSAIAQQMLLQAMVKNKRHILFFILGIGLTNFALGLAVYYGIVNWILRLLSVAATAYPLYVCSAELAAGLAGLLLGGRLIVKTKRNSGQSEENTAKSSVRLSPLPLFCLGAVFCAVELTSALPYFGFLAMLAGYQLAFPYALLFMLLYNFMYILPLLLLYWGYNKLQGTTVIRRLERILDKVSAYVVPGVITIAGLLLLVHGLSSLLL